MTYSFPCQDLSLAGHQKGFDRESNTRSGLLWEVERLLNECEALGNLPQILLMENVTQVHSDTNNNLQNFTDWVTFLEKKGYGNYLEDLNAKDFGVAQNRDRSFMVSILGNYSYTFPERVELNKTIKDYLESDVADKFYVHSEKAKELIDKLIVDGKIDCASYCADSDKGVATGK